MPGTPQSSQPQPPVDPKNRRRTPDEKTPSKEDRRAAYRYALRRFTQVTLLLVLAIIWLPMAYIGSKFGLNHAQMLCGTHDDSLRVWARTIIVGSFGVAFTIWIVVHKFTKNSTLTKDLKRREIVNSILAVTAALMALYILFSPFITGF